MQFHVWHLRRSQTSSTGTCAAFVCPRYAAWPLPLLPPPLLNLSRYRCLPVCPSISTSSQRPPPPVPCPLRFVGLSFCFSVCLHVVCFVTLQIVQLNSSNNYNKNISNSYSFASSLRRRNIRYRFISSCAVLHFGGASSLVEEGEGVVACWILEMSGNWMFYRYSKGFWKKVIAIS